MVNQMSIAGLFSDPSWGDEVLCCPACGGAFLHHETVEVFERGEDAKHGLHVTVNGNVTVDTNMAGNPSMRRYGLLVRFGCENCNAQPVLSIVQHKGNTFIEMTFTPEI